jgi:hypothetical protein
MRAVPGMRYRKFLPGCQVGEAGHYPGLVVGLTRIRSDWLGWVTTPYGEFFAGGFKL